MAARKRLPEDQIITVNVSPAALLTDEVQLLLLDGGPLDGVMIELTEHREPEPIDEVTCVVEAVRDLGATIALDDVGGGRGALRYARALRPDVIKLDGDVVRHVDTEPMQRVMVSPPWRSPATWRFPWWRRASKRRTSSTFCSAWA